MYLLYPTAKLLRKNYNNRVSKEDRHILKTADRCGRRNHVRLQVPSRRREDPVPLRRAAVPRIPQLEMDTVLSRTMVLISVQLYHYLHLFAVQQVLS